MRKSLSLYEACSKNPGIAERWALGFCPEALFPCLRGSVGETAPGFGLPLETCAPSQAPTKTIGRQDESRSKVCSGFAAVRWEMFICREFRRRSCLYR